MSTEKKVRLQAMVEPEVGARIEWFARNLRMSTSAFIGLVLDLYCDDESKIVGFADALREQASDAFEQAVEKYESEKEARLERQIEQHEQGRVTGKIKSGRRKESGKNES